MDLAANILIASDRTFLVYINHSGTDDTSPFEGFKAITRLPIIASSVLPFFYFLTE